MNVPFLDLKRELPEMEGEIKKKVDNIILSTKFVSGKYVKEFEKAYAKYIGVKHCICVNSGTAALQLALMAYDIGYGDEVIVPANTFIATAEAVSLVGAKPVLVDIDEESFTINSKEVERVINKRTKAIIPVHLYGQCADMDEINMLAKKNNIIVIEDACQAHGAEYKGKKAGSLGDAAAFSFYPGKNLGAWGEGGAVTTNDNKIAKKIRMLRDHGSERKYYHEYIGGNFRMSEIQGAVLLTKLKYLDEWNKKRRNAAERYSRLLCGIEGVKVPIENGYNKHVYHLYVIRVKERKKLIRHLSNNNVATLIHYPLCIHLQKAYENLGVKKGSLPVCETVQEEVLSLPMFPDIKEEEIKHVSTKIKEFFSVG